MPQTIGREELQKLMNQEHAQLVEVLPPRQYHACILPAPSTCRFTSLTPTASRYYGRIGQ